MMNYEKLITAAVVALALSACGGDPEAPAPLFDAEVFDGPAVATVNAETLPADLLQAYLRMSGQIDADARARDAALADDCRSTAVR